MTCVDPEHSVMEGGPDGPSPMVQLLLEGDPYIYMYMYFLGNL